MKRAIFEEILRPQKNFFGLVCETKRSPDLRFRRQHPIGDRIVDFFCVEAKLAIELDGSGHNRHCGQTEDLDRELELYEGGVRLLRFWNHEVFDNLDGVIDAIIYAIDPEKSRWHSPQPADPHLNPLPQGEDTAAVHRKKQARF
ncbi:MAG: endonuclease domain-containing protein [Chthoniobacterales bacterium]